MAKEYHEYEGINSTLVAHVTPGNTMKVTNIEKKSWKSSGKALTKGRVESIQSFFILP
jgi:hypothetical protein